MPPFRFRMATVLRLREAARDERRRHLAEALEAERILERQRDEVEAQLHDLAATMRERATGALDVDQMLARDRYQLLLKGHRELLRQQSGRIAEEIARRREALVQADREVRVLERLREVQHETHRQEEERRELAVLDEAAARVTRHDTD